MRVRFRPAAGLAASVLLVAVLLSSAATTAARQESFSLPSGDALRWRSLDPGERQDDRHHATFVTVDAAFPPRVCAGSVDVSCRPLWNEPLGDSGWRALPPMLAPPIVADPRDPDVLFGGDLLRYDRRTTQIVDVRPDGVPGMGPGSIPKIFSADGRALLAASTRVFRSTNGGLDWTAISPDWSAEGTRVVTLGVSPVDSRTFWAAFSNGAIRLTRNAGASWEDVASPGRGSTSRIRALDGSHFDANAAYAIAEIDDGSRLFRTRDGGSTWVDLTPASASLGVEVFAMGEDRFRRGLLFAATDQSVLVSFDDGDEWQVAGLDLPAAAVRAVAVHESSVLAVGAAGTWILEDITPLRQLTADVARADFYLFRPPTAWRVRASAVPVVEAPGATFTYLLGEAAAEDVTIEVVESRTGELIRRWSSHPAREVDGRVVEIEPLPLTPGLHRVHWDLRHASPVAGDDVPGTTVLPGIYQVRLTVDGRIMRQAVSVRIDPRVRATLLDLTALRDLGRVIDGARAALASASPEGGGADGIAGAALAEELRRLAGILQQADERPTARVIAAVESALARATGAPATAGTAEDPR